MTPSLGCICHQILVLFCIRLFCFIFSVPRKQQCVYFFSRFESNILTVILALLFHIFIFSLLFSFIRHHFSKGWDDFLQGAVGTQNSLFGIPSFYLKGSRSSGRKNLLLLYDTTFEQFFGAVGCKRCHINLLMT